MKVLAMSDIHGDTHWLEKQAEKAEKEKIDLVLLCGDLVEDELQTENLIGPFKKRKLNVAILHGNHDSEATLAFLSKKYGVINAHGYSFTIGDVGFFGSGGAPVGPIPTDEKTIFEYIKKSHKYLPKDIKKKIMITHVHPAAGLVEKLSFKGSDAVKKALTEFKPDLHLCGHIHECEGIEDTIDGVKSINVGKEGKIIKL